MMAQLEGTYRSRHAPPPTPFPVLAVAKRSNVFSGDKDFPFSHKKVHGSLKYVHYEVKKYIVLPSKRIFGRKKRRTSTQNHQQVQEENAFEDEVANVRAKL